MESDEQNIDITENIAHVEDSKSENTAIDKAYWCAPCGIHRG